MKTILFICLTAFITIHSAEKHSGNLGINELQKIKSDSEKAYLEYDQNLMMQNIAICERLLSQQPENEYVVYYSILNRYRLVNFAMSYKNIDMQKNQSDKLFDEIKLLENSNELKAEVNVLEAATLMINLSSNMSDAPATAAKIHQLLAEAEAIDKDNPRIYLIKGIMTLNTPPQFGGSVEGALKLFEKAQKLYADNSTDEKISWGFYESKAWNGLALQKKNLHNEAINIYKSVLKEKPEYKWVKYQLLPSASAKLPADNNIGRLIIKINGLDSDIGKVRIAVSNSSESYYSKQFYKSITVEPKNKKCEAIIENVPYGEYAISCFHDQNDNNKLDRLASGIPTEKYGFSNNATGNFGPASYDDAKFNLSKKELIVSFNVN